MTNMNDSLATTPRPRVVVIGNGMVGQRFVEKMSEASDDQWEVIVLGEEPRPAYDRVQLSAYFSGKSADDLAMTTVDWFGEKNIKLRLNSRVTGIDTAAKKIALADGYTVAYTKLVIATGSYPFVPPIPGHKRDNIFVYRTIEDLEKIEAAGKNSKSGVVIGGGLLGLECANAVKNLGVKTHVVEFAPYPMAVQLDPGGGAMLTRKIEELGVKIHCSKNTKNIADGDNAVHKLEFADGSELETDMIVFSAGIRPRDELAREAGLAVGERGGIVIDNNCLTSDEDVYAIGECALWSERIYGLVAPGYSMANVVADQLHGKTESEFTGADMSTKLKLLGVDVASIGDAHGKSEGAQAYTFIDEANGVYKKLVVDENRKKLLGAVLVGEAEGYGGMLQLALNDMDLPEQPEALILPAVDGEAAAGLGVDALPDTAQICSCNDISKGQLCSAIEGGVTTLGALKDCTTAGTSCGGCAPLVKQVLDAELEKAGVEVDYSLCEHFAHTRQELEHMVRIGGIKTFTELLETHGRGGLGCEICKPTAASIFASTWNEHVLKPQHAILQDTNDYYMANMQKDGTYSVVPRVPGGEITPEKLVVLGEVAIKYKLYTKVTGGQRIDLFGARVHELPLIWEELVAAGFESGHAYGKSLRTVKSCVGSTWCRYGVQDSVGMAIRLEERYRGIRSPHKIKFGVSGCTRECAEAQSKDFGIIAVEGGWNLYVCGNGGMKPRHADLLITEVDDETLIKYVDRLMVFYIRTADRLQRTSTWMDNLEGGLDYVKDVVINDSLGIADELEAQMESLVQTYQCEWKTAIEDENIRKRFRSFVNSDETDNNVVFVQERGQIRPATIEESEAKTKLAKNVGVAA